MGNITTFPTGLLGRLNGNEVSYFWIFSTQGRNGTLAAQSYKSIIKCSGGHIANTEGETMSGSERKKDAIARVRLGVLSVFSQK